jgi:pantothenate kinase
MDGHHLTRSQLAATPSPRSSQGRRRSSTSGGFDNDAFAAFVRALRAPIVPESRTLHAPSFDHAVRNPVAGDIPVAPSARIVVFEGDYVAMDRQAWLEAVKLMDEVWLLDANAKAESERMVRRDSKAGYEWAEEMARKTTEHVRGPEEARL